MADASKSRKQTCLEDIKRRILTLDVEPGAYLDETELAENYALSRPPLREVFNQLAGEGFVVLHKNRGAQVSPMTHKSLRNFFIAAPMIYAAVSRLAAENATTAQIEKLKETQAEFRRAIDDGDTFRRALVNQRFHEIIGEMSDNEFLSPSLRRLMIDHTRISMSFYNPRNQTLAEQRSIAADHHDQFIHHIENADPDAAAQMALDHWELSRAELESFVTPISIEMPLGRAPHAPRQKGAS